MGPFSGASHGRQGFRPNLQPGHCIPPPRRFQDFGSLALPVWGERLCLQRPQPARGRFTRTFSTHWFLCFQEVWWPHYCPLLATREPGCATSDLPATSSAAPGRAVSRNRTSVRPYCVREPLQLSLIPDVRICSGLARGRAGSCNSCFQKALTAPSWPPWYFFFSE